MCNWDTYSYDCGHLEVRLRERCSKKRTDDEIDPCYGVQVVSKDWRYHQSNHICDDCKLRERQTGCGNANVWVPQDVLMEGAHQAAVEKNAARGS